MTLNSPQPIPFKPTEKGWLKPKLRNWLIGIFILSSLSGGGYLVYRQTVASSNQAARSRIQTVPVGRQTIPITIAANGIIEAKQSTNVSPKSSGRLKSLLVDEGDAVQAGQVVAYMDDSSLRGQLLGAQGSLEAAQANLKKVETGNRPEEVAQAQATVASAEANLRQSESDLNRYDQLYKSGAISAQAVSQYRTTRNTNQAEVDKARQALKLLQVGSRPEDVEAARAQVIQQEGNLKTVQSQIEDTVIRAPFSGIVTAKYADPGDFVTPTTSGSDVSSATSSSILSLASTYQVVANVAETDISKIKVGQSVTITADAYPDRTFKGKVAQVGAAATVTSNVTSVKVKVSLDDPQRLLLPSMNVDARFDAGELSNVLVVPTVAIARQQNGTGVQVLGTDGRPRFVPIQTGLTVNDKTEVRSGLQGNEKVLVSAPSRPTNRAQNSGNRGNPLGGAAGAPGGGFPRGSGTRGGF
ncbi:MAG: efflux RND transporter periplasmic adaptor subunit [Myxacorys chilensis ATA2-1-KO14]|jgi:HlyD family secretion protein|nr:efflux RND transporter periplasmic adaptor subunit [Myxacorys chilensis ATA2-1-KO14]